MITVGMVVEGTHDYLMLQPLVRVELEKRTADPVQFRHLQPAPDATGAYGDGGYAKVIAWCKRFTGEQLDTFFTPLFAGEVGCDLIVVHMDGDAVEDIRPHTAVQIPDPVTSVADRVATIARAIEEWLAITPQRRSKLALAVPVMQSEAWILSAEGAAQTPEQIDAKTEFRRTHDRKSHGHISVYYRDRAEAVCQAAATMNGCVSYAAFQQEIVNAAI